MLAGADSLTITKFSASGFWPIVVDQRMSVLILHAPPVEILKRAVDPTAAAGHQVRTVFLADGEFMERFAIPSAVSCYGSTEVGGLSHMKRWELADGVPAGASRHGGHVRDDMEWRLDADGIIELRELEPGALFSGYLTADGLAPHRDADGWFSTGDLGRVDLDNQDHLVFIERAAESIRVKGEYVPIPWVENQLAAVEGIDDLALWKRPSDLVDDELVLYAVADPLPLISLTTVVSGLPVLMRPTSVARVSQIPRDDAVGKVRRRLLQTQEVLEWITLS